MCVRVHVIAFYIMIYLTFIVKKKENDRFSIEHFRSSIFLGQSIKS